MKRVAIIGGGAFGTALSCVAQRSGLEIFLGFAGAGDFILTAHNLQSRNTSPGVALGTGTEELAT
jgi:glycerol-3-phosphate dehydrogenase